MATKSWTLLDVQHNIVVDTPGRNSEMFVRCGLESNGAPEFDEESGRLIYPLQW